MFFFPVIVHPVLLCLAAQTLGARAEVGSDEKLIELNWEEGFTGSTSTHNGKGRADRTSNLRYRADKAFIPQLDGKGLWANERNQFPAMVWNHFPYKVKLGRISFSSRIQYNTAKEAPKEFDVVGSSDCEDWINIVSFSADFSKENETKSWNIPKEKRKEFNCVGIKVNTVNAKKDWVSIQNLKMWDTLVENYERECENECGNQHGVCNFCGKGSCCQNGLSGKGCDGQNGCSGTNCCVETHGVAQTENLTEVNLQDGTPGATSSWSGHGSDYAFKDIDREEKKTWCSSFNQVPAKVWIQLPKPVKLGKLSFTTRYHTGKYLPSKFAIVGSNDCSNWTVIIERNPTFSETKQTYFWMIPNEKRQQFKCIGIDVLENKSGTKRSTCLQNIRIWEPTLATEGPILSTKEPTLAPIEPTLATKEPIPATEESTPATEPTLATKEPILATKGPTSVTEETTAYDPITGATKMDSKFADLFNLVKQNKKSFQNLEKRVEKIESEHGN